MNQSKRDPLAEYAALVAKDPTEMPSDFSPEILWTDNTVRIRAPAVASDGTPHIVGLGFVLTGHPTSDWQHLQSLRESAWCAVEMLRLGLVDADWIAHHCEDNAA